MRISTTDSLFAWDKLPDSPDLVSLRFLLDLLPDGSLLAALRAHRGKGRNDYPVHILWRVHVSHYFLRHASMEGCLAELGRNPALRRVIGIEDGQGVPAAWNMSRFQEVLGQPVHLDLMQQMFAELTARLATAVPDLGVNLAGDSAALAARKHAPRGASSAAVPGKLMLPGLAVTGKKEKRKISLPVLSGNASDETSTASTESSELSEITVSARTSENTESIVHTASELPQPAGGRKEYKDDDGKVTATYEWFGYKFHLLVDVKHEVIIAWHITSAAGEGTGDSSVIPQLLAQAQNVLPKGRIQTLAYDKAADDSKTHELLATACIKPLIQIRNLWKDQTEQLLPGHDGNSNVVYDEAGTLYCYDKVSTIPVKHKMSFAGHEKSRGTLKYRCPAHAGGYSCPSDKKCNGDSAYGKTVRVKSEIDLRRFPPIPRGTLAFERLYKGRTAVERINARTKVYWGADDGNVTGAERFHAHLATIMLVHATTANWLACQPRYEGKSLSPTRMSQLAGQLHKLNRQSHVQNHLDHAKNINDTKT